MGQVTHEHANLMLRLYELRREPRLREAREWFVGQFQAPTPEEMLSKYPPGSAESLHIRMAVSYWDMVASIVNRGLIDDEFFFETNGEVWAVWDRLRTDRSGVALLAQEPHHLRESRSAREAVRNVAGKESPGLDRSHAAGDGANAKGRGQGSQ